MFCEKCGAELPENAAVCPICGTEAVLPEPAEDAAAPVETENTEAEAVEVPAEETVPVPEPLPEPEPAPAPAPKKVKEYKPPRKPHIVLRILLQLLSLALCLVLAVSLLGTVLLADLNHLMSAGGMKQLINAVLTPVSAPQRITPAVGALGVQLDSFTVPGDLDIGDIPEDLLTGGNSAENVGSLIDWIYEELEKASEEPLPVTKEQVEEFVADSTISEFVADKLAGYADDFINGTENTSITTEEIMALLDENESLLKESFGVELSEEFKQTVAEAVDKAVVESDLNTVIREQVFETVEKTIDESMGDSGMGWAEIQPMLQLLCSDTVLYSALGTCLVLMLLLCLLNFYNVPAGLTWIAIPSILMGAILTAPLAVLQSALTDLSGQALVIAGVAVPGQVVSILASFAGVLLPIHSAVLVLGVSLLVISIFWRVIRASVRRKRRLAAAA